MNNDAKNLLPAYRRFYETPIRGKRTVVNINFFQDLVRLVRSTSPFQSLHRTCALIQTLYSYRLCSKILIQSHGLKTILEDFCVKNSK